jgi:L-malate glycosyltransferase
MTDAPAMRESVAVSALAPRHTSPLPRVLYAVAMDGTHKFGSLEEQIYTLALAFQAEGSLFLPLFVDATNPARPGLRAFDNAGLPTAHLNLWSFGLQKLKRLGRMVSEHGIQVMHWNFYSPLNYYVMGLSALRPRLRHCLTDHNSRVVPLAPPARALSRLVKRLLLKRYQQVWCVSQYVNDCLRQQQTWSNLATCLHFINTDRFRPDPATRSRVRAETGCGDRFVVLTVANLIPEKGIDVAIRAMAAAPPEAVLWIVGDGQLADSLKSLAAELGIAKRVRFFGQQTLVQPFMQAADCLACPSLWAEAAGLVNLEALSSGLPVLASRIGGIPEYVDDRQTGLLFQPGDHTALASLIRKLMANPAECERLGARARAEACVRFSAPARLDEYLTLYRRCS